MAEKTRVHTLAKALNVTSKDIIEKCKAEGISVKNHMSTLGAGLEATVREWFSEGAHSTTVETTRRIDLAKVRKKRRAATEATPAEAKSAEVTTKAADKASEDASRTTKKTEPRHAPMTVGQERESSGPATATMEVPPMTASPADETPEDSAAEDAPASAPAVEEQTPVAETPAAETPAAETPAEATPVAEAPVEESALAADPVPDATLEPETIEAKTKELKTPPPPPESVKPAGPQNVPLPAKLSGPRVVRYEAPEEYNIPKRGPRRRAAGPVDAPTARPDVPGPDILEGRPAAKRGARPRTVGPVDDKAVAKRAVHRRTSRSAADAGEKLSEWNDQDLAERRARLRGATGRRMVSRRAASKKGGSSTMPTSIAITEAQVDEPIMAKQFCGAIGVPFQRLFPIFHREHNLMLNMSSIIPREVAETVAAGFGIELKVVEAKTGLDKLKEMHEALERTKLATRPPIVTVLGHVDHGKTSLLDHIRRARVASREDGGITQHISSYHFRQGDVAVTFLDTPGHEAFTALRARGAQLTDVVVLVIAADDGIMPQTVEAINHAKAAKVPIVVALNKIDLGTQNVNKIYGQLAEHQLTPSGDWGGEIDVIHTSATTGQGVDKLLEHLSTLAELHDFKADPTIPATGTVVEAESRQGVGAVMQVIVSEGTLKVGDNLVCGNSYGKVRALHDDTGKAVKKAGPSMPVEIWGMNEVPSSGDRFYRVENMQHAKEIADEIRQRRQIDARSSIKKARSLDDLLKQRTDSAVNELNVIIKADVDGSASVLTHTLNQFPSDEVKLTVLHAGIGAITDSDVHLADASNAIIIAFRVASPGKTRRLAEEKGVDIRSYKVIYEVTDDIKKALEGLLEPDKVIEARGAAEVREVFRITKVGLVAGSYVREGVLANNHLARVVRNGVVVRDNCKFDSLRRFKDDVKEVRNGMECGIRLEGFDDIKVGDTIESFEIVKVARTLD